MQNIFSSLHLPFPRFPFLEPTSHHHLRVRHSHTTHNHLFFSSSPLPSLTFLRTNLRTPTSSARQLRCSAGARGDNFYERLSVAQTACDAEIRAAYKKQVRKWHPDWCPFWADKNHYAQQFMMATEAYKVLCDPDLRNQYDVKLRAQMELEGLNMQAACRAVIYKVKHGGGLKDEVARLMDEERRNSTSGDYDS